LRRTLIPLRSIRTSQAGRWGANAWIKRFVAFMGINAKFKDKEYSKITKFILFICVLILLNAASVYALKPENDIFLITTRIVTFLISLFLTAAILVFSKPAIVNIILWHRLCSFCCL